MSRCYRNSDRLLVMKFRFKHKKNLSHFHAHFSPFRYFCVHEDEHTKLENEFGSNGRRSRNLDSCYPHPHDHPNARESSEGDAPSIPSTLAGSSEINIFAGLAKKVIPSVVNISTVSTTKAAYHQETPNRPRNFFSSFSAALKNPPRREQKAMALGSGFIIDPTGIILTNNHVVANADEIKIQFTEDSQEEPTIGKVIGRDPDLDVALIRVKTNRKLTALPLGDSDALNVGDYVMAAGNPYGQGHSVSHGIVSAKGRSAPGLPIADYLQVDAPINPGNSGGPLLNLNGQVVGINNAIDPRAQGIGFAIPINFGKKILAQLETSGGVSRRFIGAWSLPSPGKSPIKSETQATSTHRSSQRFYMEVRPTKQDCKPMTPSPKWMAPSFIRRRNS